MKEMGVSIQDNIDYNLGPDIKFTALLFEKIHKTPEKYPRAVGIPTKRPL